MNTEENIIFFVVDILKMLNNISYPTFRRHVKSNPKLAHLIVTGRKKHFYTLDEKILIISEFK